MMSRRFKAISDAQLSPHELKFHLDRKEFLQLLHDAGKTDDIDSNQDGKVSIDEILFHLDTDSNGNVSLVRLVVDVPWCVRYFSYFGDAAAVAASLLALYQYSVLALPVRFLSGSVLDAHPHLPTSKWDTARLRAIAASLMKARKDFTGPRGHDDVTQYLTGPRGHDDVTQP
jgi:hypothetical protein